MVYGLKNCFEESSFLRNLALDVFFFFFFFEESSTL